jgi:hypothetical protein
MNKYFNTPAIVAITAGLAGTYFVYNSMKYNKKISRSSPYHPNTQDPIAENNANHPDRDVGK